MITVEYMQGANVVLSRHDADEMSLNAGTLILEKDGKIIATFPAYLRASSDEKES